MLNYFVYAGRRSQEFGLYISGSGTFVGAEWEITEQPVPGRSGEFLISQNRMKNQDISYPAFIREKFKDYAEAARLWLLNGCEYKRLEDSYHPEYFRIGYFKGPLDFDVRALNRSAELTLTFRCKPQRYRKDGEYPRTVSSGNSLFNFWMPSLPLIQITGTGSGQITVGQSTVNLENMTGSVTLDSEVQDVFDGTTPMNQNASISGGFPVLRSGENRIAWSGGITAVQITPRWWTV